MPLYEDNHFTVFCIKVISRYWFTIAGHIIYSILNNMLAFLFFEYAFLPNFLQLIFIVFQVNCRLFAFEGGQWKERCRGQLRLNDSDIGSRLVCRATGSLRVLLNTKVISSISLSAVINNVMTVFKAHNNYVPILIKKETSALQINIC